MLASKNVLVHVGVLKFKPEATETEIKEAYSLYQTLGEDCGGKEAGILYAKVGWNRDQRKGYLLMEFFIFADNDALQRFRVHPGHERVSQLMRRIADWVIGDIDCNAAQLSNALRSAINSDGSRSGL
jgi:hypothetical protein